MKTMLAIAPPLVLALVGAVLLALTWFGACLLVFGALDAYGRYKDYRYLSRFAYHETRLVLFYGRSFCGRWLMTIINPAYAATYRNEGYKWWHFLPDDFPFFLTNPNFYRALVLGHKR